MKLFKNKAENSTKNMNLLSKLIQNFTEIILNPCNNHIVDDYINWRNSKWQFLCLDKNTSKHSNIADGLGQQKSETLKLKVKMKQRP